MKTTVEINNSRIVEVLTVWTDAEANEKLATGKWILLHGGCAHRDVGGFQAKPVYMLGRTE